ncbi:MAG: DUF951 domain-containing protein [Ruminococcus sp.]
MAAVVYEVGDIVTLKKGHPCGSQRLGDPARVGADFRLKCMGCGPPDHGTAEAWWRRTQENLQKNSGKNNADIQHLKKVC